MYTQSLPKDGDWECDRSAYAPKELYARTKREQVVITEMLAERLRGRGVAVHGMHPGWADTEGLKRAMPNFRRVTRPIIRTADQGADTIVWSAPLPSRRRRRPVLAGPAAPPDSLPDRARAPGP